MKKFLVYIFFSLLLIFSVYALLNELFFNKRPFVILLSLLGVITSTYAAYKFFKKNILPFKHH